ncbi:MAG: hypothetical protein U1F15_14180 [Burkholderiales bacterium]
MIEDVVSGAAWAYSPSPSAIAVCDLTLTLPTTTGLRVYAEMMMTSYSQGWNPQQVGSAAMRIVRGTVMGPGGIGFVDIPADNMNNSANFNKCLAVDYRVACALAEVTVNANAWYHAPPAPAAPRPSGKLSKLAYAVKVDGTGIAGYTRRIVGHREFLPSPEDAERETLERAAEVLEVRRSRLTIARLREGARPRGQEVPPGAPMIRLR